MLNLLRLLDETVNKACSNHQGNAAGMEIGVQFGTAASRVRLDEEVSVLVVEAVQQA